MNKQKTQTLTNDPNKVYIRSLTNIKDTCWQEMSAVYAGGIY